MSARGGSTSARERAARLSAARHAPVVDHETLDDPAPAPVTEAAPVVQPRQSVRVRPVKVSLELAPELHADLNRWLLDAARELGRGRVNSTEPLRVLVRRLVADPELSAQVLATLRQEGRR